MVNLLVLQLGSVGMLHNKSFAVCTFCFPFYVIPDKRSFTLFAACASHGFILLGEESDGFIAKPKFLVVFGTTASHFHGSIWPSL